MTVYNSMMNIMPYYCRYCYQGYKALQYISQEARNAGLLLTEMIATDAEKEPVWNRLHTDDPILVNGFGHGRRTLYTGDSETAIFSTEFCDILARRIVYLLSCMTGDQLGPEIINQGGKAYGGYKVSWTWIYSGTDPNIDPYTDWYGEGFYRSSNEFPIALIQGANVENAKTRCLAEYDRWINIWETERSDDEQAAEIIKWLTYDKSGLVVLGDLSAKAVVPERTTRMPVTVAPPKYIQYATESFNFTGELEVVETSERLSGKTVGLWMLGGVDPEGTAITDAEGRWSFEIQLPKGLHKIYVEFSGDDENSPTSTRVYNIEVEVLLPKVFGQNYTAPSNSSIETNAIRGSYFTCPELGQAQSISLFLDEAPVGNVKCAIYKKSDNSLVGYTEEKVSPPEGWVTCSIISGGKLESGVDYWIMAWTNGRLQVLIYTNQSLRAAMEKRSYDSFPEVLSATMYDLRYSIYCTYIPTPFEPVPEHTLTVNSAPMGVLVSVDAMPIGTTPISKTIEEGQHLIEVPEEIVME